MFAQKLDEISDRICCTRSEGKELRSQREFDVLFLYAHLAVCINTALCVCVVHVHLSKSSIKF